MVKGKRTKLAKKRRRRSNSRVVEYFAVVGPPSPLARDYAECMEPDRRRDIEDMAIVADRDPPAALYDLAVMYGSPGTHRRKLSADIKSRLAAYEFLESSVEGGSANLNAGSFIGSPCFLFFLKQKPAPGQKLAADPTLFADVERESMFSDYFGNPYDFDEDSLITEEDEEDEEDEEREKHNSFGEYDIDDEEDMESEEDSSHVEENGSAADRSEGARSADEGSASSGGGDDRGIDKRAQLAELRERASNLSSAAQEVVGYIIGVTIVLSTEIEQVEAAGYNVIWKCPDGTDANLNRGGSTPVFLAIKRANVDAPDFQVNAPAPVTDVVVINRSKGESTPRGYHLVRRGASCNVGKSFANEIQLAVRYGKARGVCNIPLMGATLDRFPAVDSAKLPLPSRELPMFVFPSGLHLRACKPTDTPLPSCFSFVFTNARGDLIYVCCLQFYEELQRLKPPGAGGGAQQDPLLAAIHDVKLPDGIKFFTPRAICVMSLQPLYRSLQRFLRQIYLISMSRTRAPLERYLGTFIRYVPMPMVGGREFRVVLDMALQNEGEVPIFKPIRLKLPPLSSLPMMDLHFKAPFQCLRLRTVVRVFSLILTENRILFLSKRSQLLLEVIETFRSLIFPLQWSSAYIPRLPQALYQLLEAPIGGYIFGIPESSEVYAEDPEFLDFLSTQEKLFVVDLDDDDIHVVTDGNVRSMQADMEAMTEIDRYVKLLPAWPLEQLLMALAWIIYRENGANGSDGSYAGITEPASPARFRRFGARSDHDQTQARRRSSHSTADRSSSDRKRAMESNIDVEAFNSQMIASLDAYESAFEFALTPDLASSVGQGGAADADAEMTSLEIREAFLVFMGRCLGNFERHVLHPESTVVMEVSDLEKIGLKPKRSTEIFLHSRSSSAGTEAESDGGRKTKRFSLSFGFGARGGGQKEKADAHKAGAEAADGKAKGNHHGLVRRDSSAVSDHIIGQRFDAGTYLADSESACRPLLSRLLETQMFAMMVHHSADHSNEDFQLRFFNRVAFAVKHADDRYHAKHSILSKELPPFQRGLTFLCEPADRTIRDLPGFEVDRSHVHGKGKRIAKYFNAMLSNSGRGFQQRGGASRQEDQAAAVSDKPGDPPSPSPPAPPPSGEATMGGSGKLRSGPQLRQSPPLPGLDENAAVSAGSDVAKPRGLTSSPQIFMPPFPRGRRASVRWSPTSSVPASNAPNDSSPLSQPLDLSNAQAGPLVLPGPAKVKGFGNPRGEDLFGTEGGKWPATLDVAALDVQEGDVPPLLLAVYAGCTADLNEQRDRRILTRSQTEMYDQAKEAHKAFASAFSAVGTTIVDTYACYFLALPQRVRRSNSPLLEILFALGLLKRLHRDSLLEWLDLPSFRCILVACGRIGGTFMKCIAGGIFNAMVNLGHATNSVLVGLYAQALSEEDEEISMDFGEAVGAYLRPTAANFETRFSAADWIGLAELGLQWCKEFTFSGAEPYLQRVEAGLTRLAKLSATAARRKAETQTIPLDLGSPQRALRRQHSLLKANSDSADALSSAQETLPRLQSLSAVAATKALQAGDEPPAPTPAGSGSDDEGAAEAAQKLATMRVRDEEADETNGGEEVIEVSIDVPEETIECYAEEPRPESAGLGVGTFEEKRVASAVVAGVVSAADEGPAAQEEGDEHGPEAGRAKKFSVASSWDGRLLAAASEASSGSFRAETMFSVPCGVVSMWSGRPCDTCGWTPTDEEIQDRWHEADGRESSRSGSGGVRWDSGFRCSSCGSMYVARLSVQLELRGAKEPQMRATAPGLAEAMLQRNSGENMEDPRISALSMTHSMSSIGRSDSMTGVKTMGSLTRDTMEPGVHYSFDYMSPRMVRSSLERIVIEKGESALTAAWMLEHERDVYWNAVWYCHRLTVPVPFDMKCHVYGDLSGVPSEVTDEKEDASVMSEGAHVLRHEYIIIGWDENVTLVRAKIASDIVASRLKEAIDSEFQIRCGDCSRFFKPWVKLQLSVGDLFPDLSTQQRSEVRQARKLLLSGQADVAEGAIYLLLKVKSEVSAADVNQPARYRSLFSRLRIYQLMLLLTGHYSCDVRTSPYGEPSSKFTHLLRPSPPSSASGSPCPSPRPPPAIGSVESVESYNAHSDFGSFRCAAQEDQLLQGRRKGSLRDCCQSAVDVYGSFDIILRSFRKSKFDLVAKAIIGELQDPILETYGTNSAALVATLPTRDHVMAFRTALGSLM